MLRIAGIDPQRVKLYGKYFLKHVQTVRHRLYEMNPSFDSERPLDPNHQIVIDISSDDDRSRRVSKIYRESEHASPDERSSHFPPRCSFHPSADVEAFNAQCMSYAKFSLLRSIS